MAGPGSASSHLAPNEAVEALLPRLAPVEAERVELDEAPGRVLAAPLHTDRPSPSCDVSAMDGYALRLDDLRPGPMPVEGEIAAGAPPRPMPHGKLVRIFTGAPVPVGADAVVPRERVDESLGPNEVAFDEDPDVTRGSNIRRQGENLDEGASVAAPGQPIGPALAGALATFGEARPRVHRRLRARVLVTGNELVAPSQSVEAWQIRDGNGPALEALLAHHAWIERAGAERVPDEPERLAERVAAAVAEADVVLVTGGVSAGDHDHVPAAVAAAGAETVFHGIRMKPGKPMLGAVAPGGGIVLGLPGNPVSVLATVRRIGLPAMRRLAGLSDTEPSRRTVRVAEPDERTTSRWWYRLVRRLDDERVALVPSKGSGDPVAAARSDGLVELPPDAHGAGPWPFYGWAG